MTHSLKHKIHFSVDEAQLFIKKYLEKLSDLSKLAVHLREQGYDIYRHKYFGGLGPNGDLEHPAELEKMVVLLKFFESKGVLIKDVESGLIDFPYIRKTGEEVYLCFQLGETSLNFWHHIEAGYIGRQPLNEL